MADLPSLEPSLTVQAIYRVYEERARQSRRRGHLGGSAVGRECAREQWYAFRWAARPAHDGRLLRLFDTGHREEDRLLHELRRVGLEVHDRDPQGKQWRFTAHGGHFSGSLDAVVRGVLEAPRTWHLAEFKTSNAKAFRKLKKDGVEKAKPEHYAQMQVYMGLADLTRAFYLVVCKDTDTLYAERVHFDRAAFERLLERARMIIEASEPPTRVSADPERPPCSWCDYRHLCHDIDDIDREGLPGAKWTADVNCRTCAHSTPVVDDSDAARWECGVTGESLSVEAQARGCSEHLYIPALVPFAEPVDAGDGHVLYQVRKKGARFANVSASAFPALDVPHYSSRELAAVPPQAIGNEVLEAAREMGGEVEAGWLGCGTCGDSGFVGVGGGRNAECPDCDAAKGAA
jgi:hypothetical protein